MHVIRDHQNLKNPRATDPTKSCEIKTSIDVVQRCVAFSGMEGVKHNESREFPAIIIETESIRWCKIPTFDYSTRLKKDG